MRQGAYDYIHKPLDVDELDNAVTKSLRIAVTTRSSPQLVQANHETEDRHRIVGHTPAMRELFKTIGLLSRNRATVLIEGETGSGKELIARVIHESSIYSSQPYVTVDCTTLVDNLFESELFGHEKGAFTGAGDTKKGRLELAEEGTSFSMRWATCRFLYRPSSCVSWSTASSPESAAPKLYIQKHALSPPPITTSPIW